MDEEEVSAYDFLSVNLMDREGCDGDQVKAGEYISSSRTISSLLRKSVVLPIF